VTQEGRGLCLQCGRSGPVVWESLDPGHPLIRCQWGKPPDLHGHGITLGTRDQAESDAIQVQKRERRLAASHAKGSHEEKPDHKCPTCVLEKPHRGHVRARYSDPSCPRCQAAAARASESNPGHTTPATSAGAVTVQEGPE
jgi:hypothetical protein